MIEKLTLKDRIIFTTIVTILIWMHLAWDYFHGGVPIHHILHRGDLPGISNWWGGIALPLLTWFLLYLIQNKMNQNGESGMRNSLIYLFYRFLAALIFGVLLSFFFEIGSDIPGQMMFGIILISFFVSLFQPEYFLGFVLGMAYTFGAILPIGIGIVLNIIFIVTYKIVRSGILFLILKIRQQI